METVTGLAEQYVRSTLFNLVVGNIAAPDIHTQILQLHDLRIRIEEEQAAAAVRAEEARIRREKN